jgi:hypothetical protein
MDKDAHRLLNFLYQNNEANELDIHMLGIWDVSSTVKRLNKVGYGIKSKTYGSIWQRKKIYYMD